MTSKADEEHIRDLGRQIRILEALLDQATDVHAVLIARAEKAEERATHAEAKLVLIDADYEAQVVARQKAEAALAEALELCERAAAWLGPEDAGSAWHGDFAALKRAAGRESGVKVRGGEADAQLPQELRATAAAKSSA